MALTKQETYEIAGLGIAVVGLLWMIFHKSKISIDQPVGASVPTLLGSGGDSGGTGLSPTYGDDGAMISPMTIPPFPEIETGSVYAPSIVNRFLQGLANPNGDGCCNQASSTPYSGGPVAQPILPPDVTEVEIQAGYPFNTEQRVGGVWNASPFVWADYLTDLAVDAAIQLNEN